MKQLLDAHGLRIAAALVAAAALGGALYRVPALARAGHRALKTPDTSLESADLDPLGYFVSTGALVAARTTIPAGATYTVVLGNDPPLSGETSAIPLIFRTWLLPRRYTPRLHRARWVITYHHSSETLGVRYSKEIYLSSDANLVEVSP